jgi:hypothetical protein
MTFKPLTISDFSPHLHSKFYIHYNEENENSAPLAAELLEVEELKYDRGKGLGKAFSLIFLGNAESILPQKLYQIKHDAMGVNTIFIVPIGPEPTSKRMRYQAIFN